MTKICPLLNLPCKETNCMWWIISNSDCAISDIAYSLAAWIARILEEKHRF
jgi:hypothetical protein